MKRRCENMIEKNLNLHNKKAKIHMIKVQTPNYITKYFCLRFKDIFVMLIDSKKCSLSKARIQSSCPNNESTS